MTDALKAFIAELRELDAKRTPGRWTHTKDSVYAKSTDLVCYLAKIYPPTGDGACIPAAVNNLSLLLDIVERMYAHVEWDSKNVDGMKAREVCGHIAKLLEERKKCRPK